MNFLKKKFWVLTILILILILLFFVYYCQYSDFFEGATTKTAATTETESQKLIGNLLAQNIECKKDTSKSSKSNSYSCMVNISNNLFTGKNQKSKLLLLDPKATTTNSQIMQYNDKSENYNVKTKNNKEGACSDLGKVITYASGTNSKLISDYQKTYTANC